MRIVTTSLAALSLLTLMPAAPAAADSSSANLGIVDFCKVDVPTNHPDMHVGNCVSFQSTNFRDNIDGLVPHLCSYIETVHPDVFDSLYDSYDACVRDRASAFL